MNLRFTCVFILWPALAAAADSTGVDQNAMDRTANPCVDFYQYACGGWMARNPAPADRPRWNRFAELADRNEKVLLGLLQSAAVVRPGRSDIDQKIGDYYQSCLDTDAINRKGRLVIEPELRRIREILALNDLPAEVARLHRMDVNALFRLAPRADAKDSNRTIASVNQAGLSLPDRDYYLKTDARSQETRNRFQQHVSNMFRLAGERPETASAHAATLLELETKLAEASADRVTLRVPEKNYHVMSRKELSALAPGFDWDAYFRAVGAPEFDSLNVGQPDYLKQLSGILAAHPIEAWKAYLAYHLLREAAPRLSDAFEKETFDFWERYLGGAQAERPRPSQCLREVDRELGDLLGQKYLQSAFGPEAKARIAQLVDALVAALGKDIQTLPWMTKETQEAALDKLRAITRNIGYPNKWRDYANARVVRDDYFGNFVGASGNLHEQRMARIGQPTEKSEWTNMTPPTVNAFYSSATNSINFPAGILQWPYFDPERDPAVNFGGIGTVIGHEMTHGFDDSGRKFDGAGNLRDWWTAADAAEFERRAACLANEYSNFSPVPGVKLNGRLTLGENTADNGGVRVALLALLDTLQGKDDAKDGFSAEQRFFIGFGQVFCENISPEQSRLRAVTDSHSPGRFRVNGTVQNMPEFQRAFSCKTGQPMVSGEACRVW